MRIKERSVTRMTLLLSAVLQPLSATWIHTETSVGQKRSHVVVPLGDYGKTSVRTLGRKDLVAIVSWSGRTPWARVLQLRHALVLRSLPYTDCARMLCGDRHPNGSPASRGSSRRINEALAHTGSHLLVADAGEHRLAKCRGAPYERPLSGRGSCRSFERETLCTAVLPFSIANRRRLASGIPVPSGSFASDSEPRCAWERALLRR